jgi:very-short-patch-repair endonuclease
MRQLRDIELVAGLAARQCGRVAAAQLVALAVHPSRVGRWVRGGYLRRVLPRVYAVGHAARSRDADLWAAVLYAGPGAALSHATAAHWMGLVDYGPAEIHVSTPRKVTSLPGIRVHGRRAGLTRTIHNGIPVTTIPVVMVDLAAASGPRALNRALGQLDFQRLLDVDALAAACGSGQPGSKLLREAIDAYEPRRKYANGRLEEEFLELCRRRQLPLPALNARVHEIKVDAYWQRAGLVVELDSELAHSSAAQRRRDRRNDLTLRSHGLIVARYDWELVRGSPGEVCADVLRMLDERLTDPRSRPAR